MISLDDKGRNVDQHEYWAVYWTDPAHRQVWASNAYDVLIHEIRGIDDLSTFDPVNNRVLSRIGGHAIRDKDPQAINGKYEATPCHGGYIAGVYVDGGVAMLNPSPYGGSWAWCYVDQHEHRIAESAGVLPPWDSDRYVTNNMMEFYALLSALEHLPADWSGYVYSDSQITLGRFFSNWNYTGIPLSWVDRAHDATQRLGKLMPVLLSGHPSMADLRAGKSARTGRMVSLHNVWCDKVCTALGRGMPPAEVRKHNLAHRFKSSEAQRTEQP